jgi:hypothetical protein
MAMSPTKRRTRSWIAMKSGSRYTEPSPLTSLDKSAPKKTRSKKPTSKLVESAPQWRLKESHHFGRSIVAPNDLT